MTRRLIGGLTRKLKRRLKSLLHKQSPPSRTQEMQAAPAGFVCVEAVSTALCMEGD
ncbi:hypothetical protein QUA04_08015 [Microcoleus sp. S13_C5]